MAGTPRDRVAMEAVIRHRWPQIEALLDAALDLTPEDRDAFLRSACAHDAELHTLVVRLLASGLRAGDTYDGPAPDLPLPALTRAAAHDVRPPARVGPYRILHEIGRGGMGTVFLAERETFRQTVALKVVRPGLDLDPAFVRRFLEEREILASLEHPNIARLLDGGVTEEGLPFFAMEYVRGEPIDRHCDRLRLDVAQRVQLLRQACRAAAYAHERLVVHRDLKPSNMLVTADGIVKLLDFGIAKLLDADGPHIESLTRTGARLLTPEYASPEQVRARPVTPASDVYALGILLYELLTGVCPHLARGRAHRDIERVILEDLPLRPSLMAVRGAPAAARPASRADSRKAMVERASLRSTTPEGLHRRLRGDLDAIVLQALRKEPERRYATAATFADDLGRHLDGHVVSARPDSWRYRAGKVARRHRGSIATGFSGLSAGVLLLALALMRTSDQPVAPVGAESGSAPVLAIGHIAEHRQGATTGLARPLADMLATNLARTPGLRVVSTARMYELIRQAGAGRDTSSDVLISAARRAGATAVLEGALYEQDGVGLRLDVRLVELATGNLLHAETVTGNDAFALADSATARLVPGLGGAAPSGSLADVTTRSVAAYRMYEEGLRAFTDGQQGLAARFFEAALREDSTFALAAYYLGRSARTYRERWREAARAVRLAEHTTDLERLRILTGWAASTYSPAAGAFADTLATRFPDDIDGQHFAGSIAAMEGRYPEALAFLRRVAAMDSLGLRSAGTECPAACEALAEIINIYQLMDSLGAAEREARAWIRRQPNAARPWILLAAILDQQGHPDEVIAAYRRFRRLAPEYDRGPIYMAEHRIWERRYDEADRILLDLIQTGTERQRVEAPWYLAISLRQQGRLREALDAARSYRGLSPDDFTESAAPPGALMQAQVLFELGQYHQSAALFDSIAQVTGPAEAPPSARAKARVWALTHAATARAELGDTAALAAAADTILMLGTQSAFKRDRLLHHYVRGLLLTARGRPGEAIAEHRQAVASPNLGYTRVNLELGKLFLRLDRPREAVAILQAALRGSLEASNLYVTRTEVHALLGEAWEAAGRPDSAAAYYRAALRAWDRADPPLAERKELAARRLAALERRTN